MVLTLLLATNHIPQKVDGDGLILGKVGFAIDGEEVVDLPLRFELGSEGLCRDLRILHFHIWDMFCYVSD